MTTTSSTGMTEERAAQIALLALKQRMKDAGINGHLIRDLGNEARKIGISTEEAQDFVEFLLPEVLADILGRETCGINLGPKKKQSKG